MRSPMQSTPLPKAQLVGALLRALIVIVSVPFILHVTSLSKGGYGPYNEGFTCSYLRKSREGRGEASIVCSSPIQGLPQVYDLNPKFGTEFAGAEALQRCTEHCQRRRKVAEAQRARNFRELLLSGRPHRTRSGLSHRQRGLLKAHVREPLLPTTEAYAGAEYSGEEHSLEAHSENPRPLKAYSREVSQLNTSSQTSTAASDTEVGVPPGKPREGGSKGASRRLLQQKLWRDEVRNAAREEAIQTLPRHKAQGRGEDGLRISARGTGAAAKINGNVHPDGLYYIAVGVGQPPQTFFLDIDTGSRLSWITCDAPCVSCARGPNGYYKPARAEMVTCGTPTCQAAQEGGTFRGCTGGSPQEQCDYDIRYGDGSSSQGVLITDSLRFLHPSGELKSTPFVLGCAYDQDGPLAQSPAKTDGILGLGLGPLSLPAQLEQAGFLKNVFGHCLSAGPAGGGYFFLGDSLAPSPSMTWVPRLSVAGLPYYYVPLKAIRLLDRTLTAPSGAATVLDSGSSFTYFRPSLFAPLLDAKWSG